MSTAPKKPYFDLVKEAIVTLKERSGSSLQAIKKFIATTYPSLTVVNVSIIYRCLPQLHFN